jgi:hypothetical protein
MLPLSLSPHGQCQELRVGLHYLPGKKIFLDVFLEKFLNQLNTFNT